MSNEARRLLNQYGRTSSCNIVAMNDVQFVHRRVGSSLLLGTDQLSVCTVVAIASSTAAIMAHIAPLDPEQLGRVDTNVDLGRENLGNKLRQFTDLYRQNVEHFTPGQTVGAAGLDSAGQPANGDAVKGIQAWATALRLPKISWHSYGPVTADSSATQSAAMAIYWTPVDDTPAIILNNKYIVKGSAAAIDEKIDKLETRLKAQHFRGKEDSLQPVIRQVKTRYPDLSMLQALELICERMGVDTE